MGTMGTTIRRAGATATLAALMALASPAFAQMHIEVTATHINIGPEPTPRCIDRANVLQVKAGETVTLAPDATFDCVEVSGTLRMSSSQTTILRTTDLHVLPGGVFEADSRAPGVTHTLVIRDAPIDLTRDPNQWGNGFVNLGSAVIRGKEKTTHTIALTDLEAGATTVTVLNGAGWAEGDDLLFPDMRELQPGQDWYRREAPVRIKSLTRNGLQATVVLSKPLDFEHTSVLNPITGEVVQRPYVANLTRSTVIRSENPNGTRGHVVSTGHAASIDIRHAECRDLGRTTVDPLDAVTNRAGRYTCVHAHHTEGSRVAIDGLAIVGSPKWAVTIHSTSDATVRNNVGVDIAGGCFATEDGNEYRNVFDGNLCAYSKGRPGSEDGAGQINQNCPGCEGSAFWFRGIAQTITNNVAVSNAIGFNFINQQFPASIAASINNASHIPMQVKGNAGVANARFNLELWATPLRDTSDRLLFEDTLLAHSHRGLFAGVSSPSTQIGAKNLTVIGTTGNGTALDTTAVYVARLHMDGGLIAGFQTGIPNGGGREFVIRNVRMQNEANIYTATFATSLIEDVVHHEFRGLPKKWIVHSPEQTFTLEELNSIRRLFEGYPNPPMTGRSQHLVSNHQGDPNADFQVFSKGQLTTDPTSSIVPDTCGLTFGEAWANCGIGWMGAVLDPADATTFEGLVNGYAKRGHDPLPLGPPLAPLLVPNRRFGPSPENYISAVFLKTGDPALAGDAVLVRHKGPADADFGPVQMLLPDANSHPDIRQTSYPAAPGVHTFRSWRALADGTPIPESQRDWTYCSPGACDSPPPPPDPVPCQVSEPTLSLDSAFGACVDGVKTKTQTWIRTVTHSALNGGSCPVSPGTVGQVVDAEQRTVMEACTVTPPPDVFPGSVTSRVCVPNGPCYEGSIPRVP